MGWWKRWVEAGLEVDLEAYFGGGGGGVLGGGGGVSRAVGVASCVVGGVVGGDVRRWRWGIEDGRVVSKFSEKIGVACVERR